MQWVRAYMHRFVSELLCCSWTRFSFIIKPHTSLCVPDNNKQPPFFPNKMVAGQHISAFFLWQRFKDFNFQCIQEIKISVFCTAKHLWPVIAFICSPAVPQNATILNINSILVYQAILYVAVNMGVLCVCRIEAYAERLFWLGSSIQCMVIRLGTIQFFTCTPIEPCIDSSLFVCSFLAFTLTSDH